MKVSERVSELIIGHSMYICQTRTKLTEILGVINEDIKNSLINDTDIVRIKKKQSTYKEIEKIIKSLIEHGGDTFNMDLQELEDEIFQ